MSARETRSRNQKGGARRRGLSIIEMLISLAIAVTLLTAAAVAFNVSSTIIQSNDEFFRATQAARISLHQILTQIRRGSVNQTWDAQTLRLVTARNDDGSGEDDMTYKYLPANQKLMLVTNDDATDPDYVLASNVSAMTFDVEIGEDYTKAPCVVRVNVMVTVKVGKNVVTLSGSAAPRRNLVY